jgi:CRISPR-associated endoribonuclease Cas6
MRFKLTLKVNRQKFGDELPINYLYESSAAIYRILSKADKDYATWLHDNGFELSRGKRFKLFTFSRFFIPEYKIIPKKGRIKILCDTIEWQISFLPERSTQKFIEGLFSNQIFEVGDRRSAVQFEIRSVEAMPEPEYTEEMEFNTLSPMCIKFKREDGGKDYLSPTDVRSPFLIFNGLIDRYRSFYHQDPPFSVSDCKLSVTKDPKSALITVKAGTKEETKIRGYLCSFKIKAPVEIMKMIYTSGIGSLNAIGFGCVEEKYSPLPINDRGQRCD